MGVKGRKVSGLEKVESHQGTLIVAFSTDCTIYFMCVLFSGPLSVITDDRTEKLTDMK